MSERKAGSCGGPRRIVVITSVVHHRRADGMVVASAPYVHDVDLWSRHFDQLVVIAPWGEGEANDKECSYRQPQTSFLWARGRSGPGLRRKLLFLMKVPGLIATISKGVAGSDFIQLRLPGDIGFVGLMTTFLSGMPKVVKYSNEWGPSPADTVALRFQKWWLRQIWGLRKGLVTVYGVRQQRMGRIVRIPNACYWEREIEKIQSYPDQRGDPAAGGVRLCFVGRLTENKGVDIAVRAVAELRESGLEAFLEVVGDGPERSRLGEIAREVGVEEFVRFRGRLGIAEVGEVYRRSHFILVLSQTEGWARVVLEGMTWGTVPVVTGVRILREIVGEGERGLVVDRAPDKVASAVRETIRDDASFRRMASAGVSWARGFSMDSMARRIEEILRNLNVLNGRAI